MAGAVAPSGRPDVFWELRWLLIGSTGLCVAVWVLAVVLVLPGHGDWSWQVFAWGVGSAVIFAALFVAPYVAFLLWKGPAAAPPERRQWARRRVLVLAPDALLLGLVVALVAATFDAAWILVAWVVLAGVIWLASVSLGMFLVRRNRRRQRPESV